MYSCDGCLANFNRQGNLIQHLEKSTNLLCIDARHALRDKMRSIQGRAHELQKVNRDVQVEESEESDSDLEEGDLVDLDSMPVEAEVEGLIAEAERVGNDDHDHVSDGEEDARTTTRTGTAPGGISIESHNRLETPPVYVKKFGGQAGKPIRTIINGGYSNYVEQLETGSQENIWAPFTSRMEWEVAQWAKLRGPGSTSFSEFLEIEGVSSPASLKLNKI